MVQSQSPTLETENHISLNQKGFQMKKSFLTLVFFWSSIVFAEDLLVLTAKDQLIDLRAEFVTLTELIDNLPEPD